MRGSSDATAERFASHLVSVESSPAELATCSESICFSGLHASDSLAGHQCLLRIQRAGGLSARAVQLSSPKLLLGNLGTQKDTEEEREPRSVRL